MLCRGHGHVMKIFFLQQTEPETVQNVIISNHATVGNPGAVFCTVVVNGVQLIQCNVPKGEDSVTHAEVILKPDVCLFGEKSGIFLQLTFYSPNFPAKPEFHIHGMLVKHFLRLFDILYFQASKLVHLLLNTCTSLSRNSFAPFIKTTDPARGSCYLPFHTMMSPDTHIATHHQMESAPGITHCIFANTPPERPGMDVILHSECGLDLIDTKYRF